MTGHPRATLLVDLADGMAAAAPPTRSRAASAAHVAVCGPCRAEVDAYAAAVATLRAGAVAEPPAAWVRRALRIPARARLAAAADAVRTFLATLVSDPSRAPSAVALRGAAARHLLYAAGPWEVDLAIATDGVRGSVAPADGGPLPAGGRARLLRGRRVVAACELDARGRFVLRAAVPRRAVIEIDLGESRVRVEDLPR